MSEKNLYFLWASVLIERIFIDASDGSASFYTNKRERDKLTIPL